MAGKVIVIEGAGDGVGKSTQSQLLEEHLVKDKIKFISHHFPSYDTFHGSLVMAYLHGEFGAINDLSPYFIHSLYAVDRAAKYNLDLKSHYDSGELLLLDRYTTSSLIYQSNVFTSLEQKKEFIDFACDYEYNKLGLPVPDKVLFLTAPRELLEQLLLKRKHNAGVSNDIHEKDKKFLKQIYENSNWIADYLGWDIIECSDNGQDLLSVEEIHERIYKRIK